MAAAGRYLYSGMVILAASGAIAIYLNFQGFRCLTDLAQLDRAIVPSEIVEGMERNCSLITNSYVYSIYGVVAGIVLIIAGFMKKRKDNAS